MSDQPSSSTTSVRKRRRWGDAAAASPKPAAPAAANKKVGVVVDSKAKALALQATIQARLAALKAKNKPLIPPPTAAATTGASTTTTTTPRTASAALKPPPPSVTTTAGMKRPAVTAPLPSSSVGPPKAKRAKVFDLDMSVTGPTFEKITKSAAERAKPKINPYLAHTIVNKKKGGEGDNGDSNTQNGEGAASTVDEIDEGQDVRLERASKVRFRHKALNFVEPGLFSEIAERKRLKAANAEQSGFVSGRKTGTYVQQTKMEDIYGTTDVLDEDEIRNVVPPRSEAQDNKTTMPYVVEWWDMELLPSKLKKQVANYEGKVMSQETQSQMQQLLDATKSQRKIDNMVNPEVDQLIQKCSEHAALSYCKTATLVQHIVPIKPLNAPKADEPVVEPTLYLTKKELKRQRKLRRQDKQRELQDLQAAGLVPPPEPRLTLSNFIRVLGDQAFVDPSQMEQKVMEQVQARQRAHLERNAKNKLTKTQRSEKRARKLQEDTDKTGVHVALFYVKDMSHPYHRTKVDLNAQQLNITGGVVECANPSLSCVIVEGGPKAIKRYTRLMTVRMKWKGPDNAEEESDDDDEEAEDGEDGVVRHKFNPENKCGLVWTGIATKHFFKGFVFQSCETSDQARKVLRSKGVGHFWDQVLTHASGRDDTFQLKLADDTSDEEEGGKVVGSDGNEDVVKMEEE